MFRFIFNFIFYGILFYLIWRFFPEAFEKMVAWTAVLVEMLGNIFVWLFDKVTTMVEAAKK